MDIITIADNIHINPIFPNADIIGIIILKKLFDKLSFIKTNIKLRPKVTITYFVRDNRKENRGRYKTITLNAKVVDEVYKRIILIDNTIISFDNIIDIKV